MRLRPCSQLMRSSAASRACLHFQEHSTAHWGRGAQVSKQINNSSKQNNRFCDELEMGFPRAENSKSMFKSGLFFSGSHLLLWRAV